MKKVRSTQPRQKPDDDTPVQTRQRSIQEQDKIMARIEELHSELYDSDPAVTIQTYPEEVPPIMTWEVEGALRKMKKIERIRRRSS